MPTLKEVAKLSGVSLGTASAVLNNKSWVRDEVRQRVLEAAKEINYQPNQVARSLKTKRSNTIGVIVSDITNPFFPEIVRAIESCARTQGYNVILCDANEDVDIGSQSFHVLLNKQVDGIILVGGNVPADDITTFLSRDNAPIVAIERDYENPDLATILVDGVQGGFQATSHLLNLGYWPVGFISGPLSKEEENKWARGGKGRFQGYKKALIQARKEFDRSLVVEGDFHFEGGYQAMKQLLALPDPPRAVFAANDLMAIGAIEFARETGLRSPEDIAFAGYDDIPSASYCSPSLTTVPLPKQEMGQLAFEMLFKQISHDSSGSQRILLPSGDLVIRQSCGGK